MEKDKFWQYFDDDQRNYITTIMEAEGDFYVRSAEYVNLDIPDGGNVLDIGNGGIINYNIEKIDHLMCADIYFPQQVLKAYESMEKISFTLTDITKMECFHDDEFDAVIVQNVIHHLAENTYRKTREKTILALRECLRVLKIGGVLIICESTARNWFELLERTFYPFMMKIIDIVKFDHVYQYSADSLKEIIQNQLNVRAEIEKMSSIDQGKYTVFLGKKMRSKILPLTMTYFAVRKHERKDLNRGK